jgi:acyl-CoA reductase-like NAD-dependent aldehyde dehydrogenase
MMFPGVAVGIQARNQLYIGGRWIDPAGEDTISVVNPFTEEVIGHVPSGVAVDVDTAVAAARAALPGWSQASVEERATYLAAIADAMRERAQDIVTTITSELGMPVALTKRIQLGLPLNAFAQMTEWMQSVDWETRMGNSIVVREPIGVVGAITPWNYPLHQIAGKVAPALAAGCTVVLKPASQTPLCTFILAEVIDAAGLPPGVFNLVTGHGREIGERLAGHPDVDMISFTGSTAVGRRIAQLAAQTVKPTAMELGGKSPNVVLDDADLERAIPDAVAKCFLNAGQTCSALTRLIVPRDKLDRVEQLAKVAAESFTPGDPFDPLTRLGPLVSAEQAEAVRGYIRIGIDEGARLVTGGPDACEGFDRGFFVAPTVFSDVSNEMTIAQEEIFGPVLAIIPYDDEDEAVRIANATIYGLAAGVWSADEARAQRVARSIRAGQIEINGGAFNPAAPFGGYKQSGYGRENGPLSIDDFLQVKAMQV